MRTPTSTPAVRFTYLFALLLVGARARVVDREHAFIGYSERPAGAEEDCADSQAACTDWATRGECRRNKEFMEEGCPRACGLCERRARLRRESEAYLRQPPEHLQVRTQLGDIRIRLRADLSPNTVAQVKRVVEDNGCRGSNFHRSEKVPEAGAVDQYGGPGPPYALLQGSFARGWRGIGKEGAPLVKRGMVALINGGPHWFIAVRDHPEWQHGFGVWGEVSEEDMAVVDHIVDTQPTRDDRSGQVKVTNLLTPLQFTCAYLPPDSDSASASASRHLDARLDPEGQP